MGASLSLQIATAILTGVRLTEFRLSPDRMSTSTYPGSFSKFRLMQCKVRSFLTVPYANDSMCCLLVVLNMASGICVILPNWNSSSLSPSIIK